MSDWFEQHHKLEREIWINNYKKDMEKLENFIRFLQNAKLEWEHNITQAVEHDMLISERYYVRTKERILHKIESFAKHEKDDIDFFKVGLDFDRIYV